MERGKWAAAIFGAVLISGAPPASAQIIDLSQVGQAGAAVQWTGPTANARAGTSLLRADMNGDVNRADLVVGASGAGPNAEGQAYVLVMGPPYTSGGLVTAASTILTGIAPGDEFGASISAGMIVHREVPPLPPRDLIVGAPGASGGRGAVYLFTGPFNFGQTRSASAALFQVVGAAGDRLGSAIVATDLDGDGYRDIVISAPGRGRIYVIFGNPSLGGTWDLSVRAADMTITVPMLPLSLGSADFNNDGFKDLSVGVPAASGAAGAVFMLMGRPRALFASALSLATSADAAVTGINAGDAAGTTVQAADFDGDGVSDLVITAPGAAGPANARPNAGEAYIFWGGTHFSISGGLAAANVTIYGAAAGHRLGTAAGKGTIRRAQQDDLMFIAEGASAGGEIHVVYGAERGRIGATVDLARGIDRIVRGVPGALIQSVVTTAITGKGEDIIAAAPTAADGNSASAGALFAVYSPTLIPSPITPSVTVAQGSTATVIVQINNVGALDIPWAARSDTSWLALAPGGGTSGAAGQGQFTLTISPGNLAPGTYHGGYSFVSLSRDLAWPDSAAVDLTVTPGAVGPPQPTNPFGVPDPPDEGSPSGVFTPVGTNVQVLPVRDVLVTFTNVTTAGKTHVDIVSNSRGGNGAIWSPWEFRIWTTAVFTGPVTVGMAYDQSLTTAPGVIRIWDDTGRAVMQSSDRVKRLLFAGVGRLPINVTIENTPNTDLNDDGRPDLLWQNDSTRQVSAWYLAGPQGNAMTGWDWITSNRLSGWSIVGSRDFNGDGHPDIVWQHDATRQASVWYMGGPRGNTMLGWNYITSTGVAGWRIVGVSDFNGDGHPDVVWQNDVTRQVSVWYMGGPQGNTMLGWSFLSSAGVPGWRIVGLGDFDGNGHVDLVWQSDSTRQVSVWFMGGAQGNAMQGWAFLSPQGIPGWSVVGCADFDADGHPDLVWQNDATRQVSVWYLGGAQGNAFRGWSYLSASGIPGWRVMVR